MTADFLRIGHRGAAAYATENTLSSLQTALACGVDMVEMDVRRTRDGILILSHEPVLRGHGGKRTIARSSYAEVASVCLPGGEMVSTLEAALAFVHGRALVNLDLKERGYEREVVGLVRRLGMEAAVMVSSLSIHSLREVKSVDASLFTALSYPSPFVLKLVPRPAQRLMARLLGEEQRPLLPFFLLLRRTLPFFVRRVIARQPIDGLMIRAPFISAKLVDVIHNRELKLYSWPADRAKDVAKLQSIGVDGAASNRPDILTAR